MGLLLRLLLALAASLALPAWASSLPAPLSSAAPETASGVSAASVDEEHTYFAGESGAWVHNGKGTCGPTLASAGYPPQIVDEILAAEKSSSSFYSEPFGAGGPHQIYFALDKGSKQVKYIGRTDGLGRRAAEHWASKGREIQQMSGLSGLSLSDARAVEQVLIEFHGLKNLDNAINSISPRRNIYPYAIERGKAILYRAGYTLE